MDIYVQLQCNGHGFSGSDSTTFLDLFLGKKLNQILVPSIEVVQGSKTRYLFHAATTKDAL